MISTHDIPKSVLLREDGPREGFQALKQNVATADKLRLIEALCETGIREIEVTAFVRADRIPQLADADDLCTALADRKAKFPAVEFHPLYLNEQGFRRALSHSLLTTNGFVMTAASEAFLVRNNNRTIAQSLEDGVSMARLFHKEGIHFERFLISTAFGDSLEGRKCSSDVLRITEQALSRFANEGISPTEVTFADTTGWGNPDGVLRLVSEFRSKHPNTLVGLHLHDTRGTGMANVYAGLLCGVSRFDCSVGGMGGCPFAPGAAGNVPTEDVAFLCEELGIKTGLDLEKYVACAKLAEQIVGRSLPGKLKDGGTIGVVR